uniref:hypothetical protein n=1 Tax=Lactococcus garvieae TaxID=1363 RepID=UPI00359CB952
MRNQKTEDIEVLAFKFKQQLQSQGKEWANTYLQSMEKTIQEHLKTQKQQLNALEQEIKRKTKAIKGLNLELAELEKNQKINYQENIFLDIMLILGLCLALLSTIVVISAFASTLYSFGGHWIWTSRILTPGAHEPFLQKAVFVVIKILVSFIFFIFSLAIMAIPFTVYRAFLNSLSHADSGVKGWLKKLFWNR